MAKLTLHLADNKYKESLYELTEALGILAVAGAGAGRQGSISLLLRRLAEAWEQDPGPTVKLLGEILHPGD